MRSYIRAFIVIAVGCVVVALFRPTQEEPAAPILPAQADAHGAQTTLIRVPPSGPRIWYGADHYPRLSLPDGQQEVVRSVLNITKPMTFGSFVWNDDGIPDGPLWVRVDLGKQLLSVFRGGHEIGSAVILYGATHKQTPTGNFPILEKQRDYHSRTYDAPMPFMLRLTNDGVAIHGSNVREDWATHGCIGVPLDFARLLFSAAKKGDLVVILGAEQGAGKA